MKDKLVKKSYGLGKGVLSFSIIIVLAVFLSCVALYLKRTAEDEMKSKLAEKTRLEQLMAAEEERSVAIDDYRAYVQTRGYLEDVARNVLGLVYEDEIIFEPGTANPTPVPTSAPEE